MVLDKYSCTIATADAKHERQREGTKIQSNQRIYMFANQAHVASSLLRLLEVSQLKLVKGLAHSVPPTPTSTRASPFQVT